jgi:hypothetical protein
MAVMLAERLCLTDNAGPAGLAVGNGSVIKDCVATGNIVGLPSPGPLSGC